MEPHEVSKPFHEEGPADQAGWMPDPTDPTSLIYWDGQSWGPSWKDGDLDTRQHSRDNNELSRNPGSKWNTGVILILVAIVIVVTSVLYALLRPATIAPEERPWTSNSRSLESYAKETDTQDINTQELTQVSVPNLMGQSQRDVKNWIRTTDLRVSFFTAVGYHNSVACQVQGRATIVDQNPRPGSRVPIGTTIHAYLDC